MATYPVKMLKDEEGKPFVPLISIDSIKEVGGETLEQQLDKKLETTNIIAGTQIALEVEGNNVIISNSAEGTKLINNLDQTTVGVGALDAAQGKVLKESIPEVINNLTTIDSKKALSAHQGYILAGRSVPVGGGTGQVLMKSADDDYSLTWGDAADPNAIVGDGSIKKIVELTYNEYLALESQNQIEPTTEYHISDWNENERTYLTPDDIKDIVAQTTEFKNRELRVSTNDATTESNIGAIHPITGQVYLYANDAHHGLYSTKWNVLIDASDEGIIFNGIADRATADGNGNNIAATYQTKPYDSGWRNIVFENGAAMWGDNFSPARYRRIGDVVYLNGLFTSNTTGGVQFTLPVGFRPTSQYESHIIRHGVVSKVAYINQGAIDGKMVLQDVTEAKETSLNGISFLTNDAIPG